MYPRSVRVWRASASVTCLGLTYASTAFWASAVVIFPARLCASASVMLVYPRSRIICWASAGVVASGLYFSVTAAIDAASFVFPVYASTSACVGFVYPRASRVCRTSASSVINGSIKVSIAAGAYCGGALLVIWSFTPIAASLMVASPSVIGVLPSLEVPTTVFGLTVLMSATWEPLRSPSSVRSSPVFVLPITVLGAMIAPAVPAPIIAENVACTFASPIFRGADGSINFCWMSVCVNVSMYSPAALVATAFVPWRAAFAAAPTPRKYGTRIAALASAFAGAVVAAESTPPVTAAARASASDAPAFILPS